jgi:hypothetical protein
MVQLKGSLEVARGLVKPGQQGLHFQGTLGFKLGKDNLEHRLQRTRGLYELLQWVASNRKPNLSTREANSSLSSVTFLERDVTTMGGQAVYRRIDTGDARPIRQPLHRLPFTKQTEENEMLKDMVEWGVTEEFLVVARCACPEEERRTSFLRVLQEAE